MRVSMIAATTVCGRISPGIMGSSADRRFLEQMRDKTDASLLGAGTLREGDAQMRGPGGILPRARLRAVVTQSGDLPFEARTLFQEGPRPLLFTAAASAPILTQLAGARAEVVVLPPAATALSLPHLVAILAGRGVKSLLIEGGARLNYAALDQQVVDEILVTITPKISGDRRAASLVDGPAPLGMPFLDLALRSCEQAATGELFCCYEILYPRR